MKKNIRIKASCSAFQEEFESKMCAIRLAVNSCPKDKRKFLENSFNDVLNKKFVSMLEVSIDVFYQTLKDVGLIPSETEGNNDD